MSYNKLQVFLPSSNFGEATKVANFALVDPKPDQVRVKHIYAGVNATDINTTAGRYFSDGKVPFDIGLEALGIVDAIGSNVQAGQLSIGQAVLIFWHSVTGEFFKEGFSEYSYQPAEALYPVPELNPKYLVALINGLTATIGLDMAGQLKPGVKVLVTAAAGGTGHIAVQWAKRKGCYVIGTTSSEEKATKLKDLGADFVINYKKHNLNQVLNDKFPDGINVVWETVGGETMKILLNHLSPKGRLIMIGSVNSYKEFGFPSILELDPMEFMLGSKTFTAFGLNVYFDEFSSYLPQLIEDITNEKLEAHIDLGNKSNAEPFFGLDQVYRAQEYLHEGKNFGKVVVKIQDA